MSTVISVLHVACAVFLVGPMAILPMTAARAVRTGSGAPVRSLARSMTWFTWLSLATLVFGFALAGMHKIPFGRTWVWLSVVLYAVAFLLALLVLIPALRRAARRFETATPGTSEAAASGVTAQAGHVGALNPSAAYGMVAGWSGIVALLLLAVVVLMVWRP